MNFLAHFLLFQVCWHICVVGAALGYLLVGPLFVSAAVLAYLLFHPYRKHEALVVVFVVLLGSGSELLLVKAGAFSFPEGAHVPWGYPLWMSAVWAIFATTLNSFFNWLAHRYFLAGVFGFFGGIVSHWAGAWWGALAFDPPELWGLCMVGASWAFIIPTVVLAAQTLKKRARFIEEQRQLAPVDSALDESPAP